MTRPRLIFWSHPGEGVCGCTVRSRHCCCSFMTRPQQLRFGTVLSCSVPIFVSEISEIWIRIPWVSAGLFLLHAHVVLVKNLLQLWLKRVGHTYWTSTGYITHSSAVCLFIYIYIYIYIYMWCISEVYLLTFIPKQMETIKRHVAIIAILEDCYFSIFFRVG